MKETSPGTSPNRPRDWAGDARYRQLVELAPDGILVHDGERIVLGNAAAARLAGAADREALIGLAIDTFLDPPYLKAVEAELTDAIHPTEPARPVRDTFHRLDGSECAVEVRAVAFMDQGRPSAHLIIRDISERLAAEAASRAVEERLHQAERWEAVGALAGGVAHEVNNMMAVVFGFGEFLLRDDRLPEDCLADMREITKAAARAATVTRELLAFSRRAVHHPRAVDLDQAVSDAEPVIRRLMGDAQRVVVLSGAASRVWVDPAQLQQVILNLAINARDAMSDGGMLTIATGETDQDGGVISAGGIPVPAGRYATLLVRDTGKGMDAALLARIFEPFFTTKPVGQGTGLGLAAVHGMVIQHHGYITVSSEPAHGTTFTVYLPMLSSQVPESTGAPGSSQSALRAPDNVGATVLLVDDEASVRRIAARSLERGGFRVLQAENAERALELTEAGPPDLVLTDLTMPGIGGAELVRRVKQRWPALPILVMSGHSTEDLGDLGGFDADVALIPKPFSPGGLVASVVAALLRTRERRASSF